jgi:PIN domain nuclease of toxin-antitoxin system
MIVLDTHAWIWWAGDQGKLPARVRRRLEREPGLAISAISCWEVGMLIERGRLKLLPDARLGILRALQAPKVHAVPVSDSIATEAGLLGASFHGDPADRIIVATAVECDAILVTKDEQIRSCGRVRTLW